MAAPVRFRFDEFVLAPRRRLLLRGGAPVALIPKYFDLLVLLVERRNEAVSKETIFSAIWSDVIVSDGALAQAVRTLRRTLGDSSREPRFIRTVSRHGYQFVHAGLIEEPDSDAAAAPLLPAATPAGNGLEGLVDRLLETADDPATDDEARDAAERLHALGTREAIAALVQRPRHAAALAILRDARWDVPGAGDVPLDARAVVALIRLRLTEAGRVVARRWAAAAAAGGIAGLVAGILGGVALYLSPESTASPSAALALGALGALAGGFGAAAIGAGLAAAEALARARRGIGLAACGAAAGLVAAGVADLLLAALLDGLTGQPRLPGNSLLEGLVIGSAAGIGYAMATRQPPGGGLAAPAGRRRVAAAGMVALFTAAGAGALALSGGLLVGGIINEIAGSTPDARLMLAPLGRLIGEPDFGPVTRVLLSAFEGGAFGFALSWGLTARPSGRT